MSKEIKIKPIYNRVVFQVKRTPGDARRPFASGGIYERTIPEGYYMTRKAPKKINPIKKFFVGLIDTYKGIRDAMKPETEKPLEEIDVRGTTIQI